MREQVHSDSCFTKWSQPCCLSSEYASNLQSKISRKSFNCDYFYCTITISVNLYPSAHFPFREYFDVTLAEVGEVNGITPDDVGVASAYIDYLFAIFNEEVYTRFGENIRQTDFIFMPLGKISKNK